MENIKHLKSTYVLVVFLSGTLLYCRVYFKIKIYFIYSISVCTVYVTKLQPRLNSIVLLYLIINHKLLTASKREYKVIYRGPSLFTVVWFGFSATSSPLSRQHVVSFTVFLFVTGWWERGERAGEEPNPTTARKPCSSINHSILSGFESPTSCSHVFPHEKRRALYKKYCTLYRGRILRRSWDKSLESFPPCYSQSPLLTDFNPPPPPKKSELKLVCNVNIVYGNLKSSESSQPRNLNEIVHSWIRLQSCTHKMSTLQMLLRCRLLDLGATWEGLTAGVFKALIQCLFNI